MAQNFVFHNLLARLLDMQSHNATHAVLRRIGQKSQIRIRDESERKKPSGPELSSDHFFFFPLTASAILEVFGQQKYSLFSSGLFLKTPRPDNAVSVILRSQISRLWDCVKYLGSRHVGKRRPSSLCHWPRAKMSNHWCSTWLVTVVYLNQTAVNVMI